MIVTNPDVCPAFKKLSSDWDWDLGLGTWDLGLGTWDLGLGNREYPQSQVMTVKCPGQLKYLVQSTIHHHNEGTQVSARSLTQSCPGSVPCLQVVVKLVVTRGWARLCEHQRPDPRRGPAQAKPGDWRGRHELWRAPANNEH